MAEQVTLEPPEATITDLNRNVRAAEKDLLKRLEEDGAAALTPSKLQQDAQNGHSPAVMSIAFWRLLRSGQLTLDSSGVVHVPATV